MDPRLAVIDRRLDKARRVIAVTGGKGGIGKTMVASTLALVLARRGRRAGLLDLDLTGPCDHLVLGLDDRFPTETFGVEPPVLDGIEFMSVAYFLRDAPAPLRGDDVTNALIELLAVTCWSDLDVLIIDMPPGLGDATLDTVRLLPRAEYLLISTASSIVVETVRRTLRFHVELKSRIAGVLENMARGDGDAVCSLAREFDLPYLGALPFDPTVEDATGDTERLAATPLATAMGDVVDKLFADGE
jgi:ATP-binding protein involved in chromosome partitioning